MWTSTNEPLREQLRYIHNCTHTYTHQIHSIINLPTTYNENILRSSTNVELCVWLIFPVQPGFPRSVGARGRRLAVPGRRRRGCRWRRQRRRWRRQQGGLRPWQRSVRLTVRDGPTGQGGRSPHTGFLFAFLRLHAISCSTRQSIYYYRYYYYQTIFRSRTIGSYFLDLPCAREDCSNLPIAFVRVYYILLLYYSADDVERETSLRRKPEGGSRAVRDVLCGKDEAEMLCDETRFQRALVITTST